MLREVARLEDWTLEPVPCEWERCLRLLEEGTIDLMPDVAYSDVRAQRFDFHRVPALPSWSQVYRRPGVTLQSVLDLEGKRVVVLDGSVQQEHLAGLLNSFGLRAQLMPVKSFDEAFRMVASGAADAVAANRYSGDGAASRYGLAATSLVFLPSKLYFAADKGGNADLLAAIDARLDAWQSDTDSFYFQTLARWGQQATQPRVPDAFWWGLGLVLGMLVLALGFVALLRREVARQTRALRAGEQKLATILNGVDAYIYIKDPELRYQYVNRKICEAAGLAPESIVGRTDVDLRDAATAAQAQASDRLVLETRARQANEMQSPQADGQPPRTLLSVKLPLLAPDGSVSAICGIATDITDLKQAEAALRQLTQELESRVAQRTAELERSEQLLREANQELQTFAYTVAHDLKSPLRGIEGFSQLLQNDYRDRLDAQALQFLDNIRRATVHMAALINDLLAYSRIERREQALSDVALAPLLRAVLAPLLQAGSAQGAELQVDVDPALRVRADAQGLTIALRNLVENALKFSRASVPPRIRIVATRSGSGVELAVRDNGVGFDMKFHDRIFSIFQRLHRAEDYPGTGIGLAIVRKAVDRMGGRVWADSRPGEGATFTIELPEAAAP